MKQQGYRTPLASGERLDSMDGWIDGQDEGNETCGDMDGDNSRRKTVHLCSNSLPASIETEMADENCPSIESSNHPFFSGPARPRISSMKVPGSCKTASPSAKDRTPSWNFLSPSSTTRHPSDLIQRYENSTSQSFREYKSWKETKWGEDILDEVEFGADEMNLELSIPSMFAAPLISLPSMGELNSMLEDYWFRAIAYSVTLISITASAKYYLTRPAQLYLDCKSSLIYWLPDTSLASIVWPEDQLDVSNENEDEDDDEYEEYDAPTPTDQQTYSDAQPQQEIFGLNNYKAANTFQYVCYTTAAAIVGSLSFLLVLIAMAARFIGHRLKRRSTKLTKALRAFKTPRFQHFPTRFNDDLRLSFSSSAQILVHWCCLVFRSVIWILQFIISFAHSRVNSKFHESRNPKKLDLKRSGLKFDEQSPGPLSQGVSSTEGPGAGVGRTPVVFRTPRTPWSNLMDAITRSRPHDDTRDLSSNKFDSCTSRMSPVVLTERLKRRITLSDRFGPHGPGRQSETAGVSLPAQSTSRFGDGELREQISENQVSEKKLLDPKYTPDENEATFNNRDKRLESSDSSATRIPSFPYYGATLTSVDDGLDPNDINNEQQRQPAPD